MAELGDAPVRDEGYPCPMTVSGEHDVRYSGGKWQWYCPLCEALLRLSVWYENHEAAETALDA